MPPTSSKRRGRINYRPGNKEKIPYPAEGTVDSIARPAGGYLWDRCAQAGVSYRSYGEWIATGKTIKEPGKALTKTLEGHFDPWFRGWDLDYPDQKRADRFIEELGRFEKENGMPAFIVLRLPNDHTSGTIAGKPTPTAFVADNDLALGRVVEAVSKSKFWKDTAIFVIEDDAQDGPDHVDAHRTVALVISPYIKRGVRRFQHVLDDEHAADDGADSGVEADEPVRRRGPADVPRLRKQGRPRAYEHVVPKADLTRRINPVRGAPSFRRNSISPGRTAWTTTCSTRSSGVRCVALIRRCPPPCGRRFSSPIRRSPRTRMISNDRQAESFSDAESAEDSIQKIVGVDSAHHFP